MSNLCEKNPLLIPEVLSTVFKYLEKKELTQPRLVCSTWKSIGWIELKKKTTICFRTTSKLESYIKFFSDHSPDSSTQLTPFTSYKFYFQFPQDCKTLVTKFFAKFGSVILKLDMLYSNIVLTEECQKYLTTLKHLTISISRIEMNCFKESATLKNLHSLEIFGECTPQSVGNIKDLLQSQKSLKKFTIDAARNLSTFSEELTNLIAASSPFHFDELNIIFPITGVQLVELGRSQLRLKFAEVKVKNLSHGISVTDALFEFLRLQNCSLKIFECGFNRWWEPGPKFAKIMFPNILQEISVDHLTGDLQFLTNCQKLKRIHISSWRPDLRYVRDRNLEYIQPMHSIESANISLAGFPEVLPVLHYISMLLPLLKTLAFKASVNNDDIETFSCFIVARFPHLTQKSIERCRQMNDDE